MDEQVKYEVSLKDLVSEPLMKMEHHAHKVEHALHGINHTAVHMAEGLGMAFALYKGVDFLESSLHSFHELHLAEGQIEAGLISTHHAAGMTFEALEKSADDMSQKFEYTKGQIMEMQSYLVTFPSVTKQTFGEAEQAIVDMSTRMRQDLKTTTIQIGKALQDPLHGITALRRVGVNFNAAQTEVIKKLVATGQAARAQALILKELKTEFAGSAEAAAASDPLFKMHKAMYDLKRSVGEAATAILQRLQPAFESLAKTAHDGLEWAHEHKDTLREIGKFAAIAAGAFFVYKVALMGAALWTMINTARTAIMTLGYASYAGVSATASVATIGFTGAVKMLTLAFKANPIGWVISILAALSAAVVYCWEHFEKFRGVIMGVWQVMKDLYQWVSTVMAGLGEMVIGFFTFDVGKIKSGFDRIREVFKEGAFNIASSFNKGYGEGIASFAKDHPIGEKVKNIHHTQDFHVPETGGKVKGVGSKASGSKVTTINIKIGSLIGNQSFHVTNMHESIKHVREQVTQALLSAVNDSQIVAGT